MLKKMLCSVLVVFLATFHILSQDIKPVLKNPSEILYREIKATEPILEDSEDNPVIELQARPTISKESRQNLKPKPATTRPNAVVKPNPSISSQALISTADWCVEPDIVHDDSDCCSYKYNDNATNSDVWYRQPKHTFSTETASREFAAKVKASMPMFIPYRNGNVNPGQGWIYGNGNFHGAIDYSKTSDSYKPGVDPTFEIHSIGNGKVVAKGWDNLSGNYVIIEHTASNGDKYRSAYFHIRDGFDHDLAKAKAIVPKDPNDASARDTRYKKFANLANPSTLLWGTNAQKIKVDAGDQVSAGQMIAYSGNTGYGGAGWGLDNDGKPTNPNSANNHLHFMMTVPDPNNAGHWVQVDPYGVYNTVGAGGGCYEVSDHPAYVRLFAAFYPDFHNVPAEIVNQYFSYYPGMGMGLQTISHHLKDGKLLASGSFQSGLPSAWYARFYMDAASYQDYFNEYSSEGFRPRQMTVTNDTKGDPRFTVLWEKNPAGETYFAFHNRTDENFTALWDDYIKTKKWHLSEHVTYISKGKRYHAGVFVKSSNNGFYAYYGLTSPELNAKFKELYDKWQMVTFCVEDSSPNIKFGALWKPKEKEYAAWYGLSPAEYQAKYDELSQKGYRLYRLKGYAGSTRFGAIWEKK